MNSVGVSYFFIHFIATYHYNILRYAAKYF
nr:MAG TPA: hypothetical protein [Caudoviricetes sp.]